MENRWTSTAAMGPVHRDDCRVSLASTAGDRLGLAAAPGSSINRVTEAQSKRRTWERTAEGITATSVVDADLRLCT